MSGRNQKNREMYKYTHYHGHEKFSLILRRKYNIVNQKIFMINVVFLLLNANYCLFYVDERGELEPSYVEVFILMWISTKLT